MNIFEKLMKITSELSTVAKNLEVGFGAAKYKAVGEADVLKAVKPLESKYGIYSYPVKRTIIENSIVETINSKAEVKKNFYVRIESIYRFVNVEKPDEFIDITSYGDGLDTGDKSVGKAMTYADKYALLKAYKIITGDDPDQFASEDVKAKTSKLDRKLIVQAQELNIDLDKVAVYYKKDAKDITNAELQECINAKKSKLKGEVNVR